MRHSILIEKKSHIIFFHIKKGFIFGSVMGVFVFSLDVCPALNFKRKLFITKTYLTGEHFCKDTAPFFVRLLYRLSEKMSRAPKAR